MSENKNGKNIGKKNGKHRGNHKKVHCGLITPAPYKLKNVVGFDDHCLTKYRNPAFSIRGKFRKQKICTGPGPYDIKEPKSRGFTFGHAARTRNVISCTPGPYQIKESPRHPAFSIIGRRAEKIHCTTPGPYNIKYEIPGPAFTIGKKLGDRKCEGGPAPQGFDDKLTKPTIPAFTIRSRNTTSMKCQTPGPYDLPKIEKGPEFTFGMKHSDCIVPLITECDRSW